ncbi:hypothetical protein H1R20_g13861, partial [Candolleomyces eurysporus]
MYIRWLLHNKKQCPLLKKVVLLTECYRCLAPLFKYGVLDKALKDLLPHSHKLDLIGFKLTDNDYNLDFWLESHINADPSI